MSAKFQIGSFVGAIRVEVVPVDRTVSANW